MDDWDDWDDVTAEIALSGGDVRETLDAARRHHVSAEHLLEQIRRTRARRDVPPVDDPEAAMPGTMDPRIFDQSTIWFDVLRRPHGISEMVDDHLRAVIAVLEGTADGQYAVYCASRGVAPKKAPRAWLEETALMRRLRAEITARGLDDE